MDDKSANDAVRFSSDPEFDRKLNDMLREVGSDVQEQSARAQAMASAGMLALMGLVDFGAMDEPAKARMIAFVFKLTSYTLAGMPAIQRTVASVHGHGQREQSVRAIVRTLALLFAVDDPEPLIETMLGASGSGPGDLSARGAK